MTFPPWRRQLPVASPLDASMLAGALRDVAAGRDRSDEVRAMLRAQFGGEEIHLTDSGTSALVLALRLVAKPGEVVAMPAYACVDLIAAARYANVKVSLYDIDPHTLSPDLDSVREALADQPAAILVAQLFGFPADVPAVRELAHARGIRVIEDSAQHAGATLHGKPAATTGDVAILSFGRGKGTTGGRGGALLVHAKDLAERARDEIRLAPASSGARDLVVAGASWGLGRPSLYAIPSAIPWLHLGETVYHDAHEPEAMPKFAAAVLTRTLPIAPGIVSVRQRNAAQLRKAAPRFDFPNPLDGGESGYLRLPVHLSARTAPAASLGIVHGYPEPLGKIVQFRDSAAENPRRLRGAEALATNLATLPTHFRLTPRDIDRISDWLRSAASD